MMRISNFYKDTLGANLSNARWSWGATNPSTNQLFLRVWDDEIRTLNNTQCILVLGPRGNRRSNGYPERVQHIEEIESGVTSYGVLCTATNPRTDGTRTIKSFDQDHLLKLGDLIRENGYIYATIESRIPVGAAAHLQTSQSTLLPDIKALLRNTGATSKDALAKARIGQGMFRASVLKMWDSKCCVTGISTLHAIRASHIKPWRSASNNERLDPSNGLPLVATIDALFDPGLVSFSEDGLLLISPRLLLSDVNLLGLNGLRLRSNPPASTKRYLLFHRTKIFLT